VRWPSSHNHQHPFHSDSFSEILRDHRVANLWQDLVKESIPDFRLLISDSTNNIELPNLKYYPAQHKVSLDWHTLFIAFHEEEGPMYRFQQ